MAKPTLADEGDLLTPRDGYLRLRYRWGAGQVVRSEGGGSGGACGKEYAEVSRVFMLGY